MNIIIILQPNYFQEANYFSPSQRRSLKVGPLEKLVELIWGLGKIMTVRSHQFIHSFLSVHLSFFSSVQDWVLCPRRIGKSKATAQGKTVRLNCFKPSMSIYQGRKQTPHHCAVGPSCSWVGSQFFFWSWRVQWYTWGTLWDALMKYTLCAVHSTGQEQSPQVRSPRCGKNTANPFS